MPAWAGACGTDLHQIQQHSLHGWRISARTFGFFQRIVVRGGTFGAFAGFAAEQSSAF